MAKRVLAQSVLPFGRAEKVELRRWRERATGKKVRRGLGRPRTVGGTGRVAHAKRDALGRGSAVHVTVRTRAGVPSLRSGRRFAIVKAAFVKFCDVSGSGFRLVHFAVLSNHLHFVVEADSSAALSMRMKRVLHSISRRLNARSVFEHGGRVSTLGGRYSQLRGWLGRVFEDRFHSHPLRSPTEMERAVRYVLTNSEHHYGARAKAALRGRTLPDAFTSVGAISAKPLVTHPRGFLLRRACGRVLT